MRKEGSSRSGSHAERKGFIHSLPTHGEDRVHGDTAVAMSPKKHVDCRFRGQFLAEMPAQLSKAHTEGNMGRDGGVGEDM